MATKHALPHPAQASRTSTPSQLARILAGPLPALPPGNGRRVIAELRAMRSPQAVEVWAHPGWQQLIGWIIRAVPQCDPTCAAFHAVRDAARDSTDPACARRLARYIRRIAESCSTELPVDRQIQELTFDPPEPDSATRKPSASLAVEAAELLFAVGIGTAPDTWALIRPAIDIAVDWWDDLATRTGAVGDALILAARTAEDTTENRRLRALFSGPTGRPLVALLVGGDQPGRRARQGCGVEAGLVYWSLLTRRAAHIGEPVPTPPPAVRRAWATTVAWIDTVLAPGPSAECALGPTVAA